MPAPVERMLDIARARWRRAAHAVADWWPDGAAGKVLLAILALGVVMRVVMLASLWPVATNLDDGYQLYASNPFEDRQHPAGYALIVAVLGDIVRSPVLPVVVQHLAGLTSGLLMFGATRRVSGSQWAGLLPAAIVLINVDVVYLEQTIMSETWAVLSISVGLYAAVRATEAVAGSKWWGLACGSALALGVTVRSATLLLIPVVVLVLAFWRPHPLRRWRQSLAPALAVAAAAAIVLVAYASASAANGERFGISPAPGWYLYGRVAQFADCSQFTPPPGTEVLCDSRPPDERPGASTYLFAPDAVVQREFGPFGDNDDLVGDWASRALRAQPEDFVSLAWEYVGAYWVPSSPRSTLGSGLDPQLDPRARGFFMPVVEDNLMAYYGDFDPQRFEAGLDLLRSVQQLTRFGGTALSIATVLVLLGLIVGDRRSRLGVAMFGIGGLALLVAPILTGAYVGRYTVPMAAPMMAAAAIALVALWRRWSARTPGPAHRRSSVPGTARGGLPSG
jgi:4-amino-4-deoxy-L-arabinose transferase-like glycosyltransferase